MNERWKMKKLVSLFLVFSLLVLSGNLTAKERRGAELIVTKKDGQEVRGELIAVKEKSLLLLDAETGADVSIEIGDVKVIIIKKKSKALKTLVGAGIGILFCGVGGALIGDNYEKTHYKQYWGIGKTVGGIIGAALGFLIGGTVGSVIGKDETIRIEEMPQETVNFQIEELRKKARIPNYQ